MMPDSTDSPSPPMVDESTPRAGAPRSTGVVWILAGVAALLVAVSVAVVVSVTGDDGAPEDPAPEWVSPWQGAVGLGNPFPNPDIEAPSVDGDVVPLVETAPDGLGLLFFGYTNCPDICPLSMTTLAKALEQLTPQERDRIRVVFATVDPARDTPERLAWWLENQEPSAIGVVPPLEDSDAFITRVGFSPVTFEEVPEGESYAVAHPGGLIVYTSDDLAHVMFMPGTGPDEMAADLRTLLDGWTEEYEPPREEES